MGSAPASLADNPFLITLLLEMQTTIFLRTEMSRKTEYVHNPCFLSANILKILGVFAENQKKKNAHRINPNRLKRIFDELEIKKEFPHEFYLCGPQGLMKMANTTLQKAGFSKQVIYKESFCATNETEGPSAKSTQDYPIKILLKGKEHQLKAVAGQPILFSGLESGLELPYSCQSGNCKSCAAKCIS